MVTTKAMYDISLAEQLLDAALEGREVFVLDGLYLIHFEAVMTSRGQSYGCFRDQGGLTLFHNGKKGKLVWT